MSGRTSRFGLNKFGGTVGGTIVDDGQKYTSLDRDTIDRLLAAVEQHNHQYVPPTSGLTAGPTLTLQSTGGTLRAGREYFYRVSIVDTQGNETIASPETSVPTPALLPAPGMPQQNYTEPAPTGTLAAGIYYYGLTAMRGAEESPLGPTLAVSVIAGQGAVQLSLPAYGQAESFQLWRMGGNELGYTRIAVITAPTATVVDNGAVPADPCACDPANMPPTTNRGVSTYAVTVALPGDVSLANATGWKIYRTIRSGMYDVASLVHFVTELVDEFDPSLGLVRSWLDVGDPLQNGQPMSFDQNMRFQPLTLDSGTALPAPAGFPEYYPFVVDRTLYFKVGTAWALAKADDALPNAAALPDPTLYAPYTPMVVGKKLYVLIDGEWVQAGGGGGMSPILTSPNGNRWLISVDDTGALVTTATSFPGPPTPPQNVTVS